MQKTISSLVQLITSRLVQEISVNIQIAWVNDCVKFFVDRDSTYHAGILYENTKEQFLLATLADTSNQVISDAFFSQKTNTEWKTNGRMLLQMQFILEISESFYEQWRRMHNITLTDLNPENTESKTFLTKRKRMFKLELTDGYRTIHAMEMKPIRCLNTKLKPGIKVLIIGPVKVVNAIMFLEPQNIEIVGGEVEELVIENAYENVLLKLLKKPPVTNPINDYAEPVYEEEAPPRNNHQQFESSLSLKHEAKPPSLVPVHAAFMDDDDDDIDFEYLDQIEAEENRRKQAEEDKKLQEEKKQQVLQESTANRTEKSNFFLDSDEMSQQQQKINHIELKNIQASAVAQKANDLLIPHVPIKLSESMEIDEVPTVTVQKKDSVKIEKTFRDDDYAYKLEGKYNYVTIDQYVQLSKREKMERTYAIEGKMSQVIKLRIEDNEWVFLAKISDVYSKSLLSVRFLDEVTARFAKRTAREMVALRERMREQPQLKMDMTKSIERVNAAVENKKLLLGITMKMKLPTDFENIVELVISPSDETKQLTFLKISEENISMV